MNTSSPAFLKWIVIAALGILLTPGIIRLADRSDVLLGEEAYYHVRMAQEIAAGNIPEYDEMSYGGRPYLFNPYHLMLALLLPLGMPVAAFFLPLVLGMITLLCISRIGRLLGMERSMVYGAMLLLIISPVFISTFSTVNPASAFIAIVALAFLLFLGRGKLQFMFALLLFSVAVFFGLLEGLLIIMLILGYYLWKNDRRCFVVMLLIAAIAAIYDISSAVTLGIPQLPPKEASAGIISELGQAGGVSLFLLLLAGIGIIITWREKSRLWPIYVAIILLLATPHINRASSAYLLFFLVIFAAKAYNTIVHMRWEAPVVRKATITMIAIGLVFAAGLYLANAQQHIQKEVKQVLVQAQGLPGDTILSHGRYGFIIEEVARKKTVLDSNWAYAPNLRQRLDDVNQTLMSRNLVQVKKNLAKYDVDYILITPQMRQGLVWNREKQGLLFLLRNNETFKKVYQADGVELWEVIP